MWLVLVLLMYGVSGTEMDETEPVSVMEGDYVTLHTNLTEILNDDTILWLFGPKHSLISQIRRKGNLTSFSFTGKDERFRGRLQVDENTGSLTIRNTRIRHSGQYILSISREKTTIKIFNVTVSDMFGEPGAVKSVSVTEGDSVTLHTDVKMHKDALMLWRFGGIIAKIKIETNIISLKNTDEKFRDRLQLDQTGSLTITNTRTTDTGLYELQIRDCESSKRFLLSVNAKDPGLSSCVIAGICVGVLVLLAAAAFALIYHRRRISKSKRQAADEAETMTEEEFFTLHTGLTELPGTDTIKWSYEADDNLIREINGSTRRRLPVCSMSLTEGDPAFLRVQTAATIQPGDLIVWTFGDETRLLVKADSRIPDINERFRDRLNLHNTTGSLIIKNIRPTDSGYYYLLIINTEHITIIRFNVTVTGDTVNEPATEISWLLPGDFPDGENEQQSSV